MNASYCQNLTLLRALFLTALICVLHTGNAFAGLPITADKKAAVILAYQKIDDTVAVDTSLSLEKFKAHIDELTNGSYNVMPLATIIEHYKNNTPLPEHSVAITFDGPYRSAFAKAFPVLIQKHVPFTVFISPQLMNSARPGTVDWTELKDMAQRYDFVDFGLHPFIYTRLTGQSKASILSNLKTAQKSFAENMPRQPMPSVFAYPFGAYNKDYRAAVVEAGFNAALTQSSGVSYAGMDIYGLPRFALTDTYGAIERFRMIVNAAPLPLYNWKPDAFMQKIKNQDIKTISFEASKDLNSVDLLNCFVSGQDIPDIHSELTPNSILVTLSLHAPLEEGRTRINCTMPGPSAKNILDTPIYRWHGMLYDLE